MILYSLQHFGDHSWIPWLARMLDHEDNHLAITYDGSSQGVNSLKVALEETPLRFRSVRVSKSWPIRWGGPSMIEMNLEAMRQALSIEGWDFYINLSGTCVPLVPQREIHEKLAYLNSDGISAWVGSFVSLRPPTRPAIGRNMETNVRSMGRLTLRGDPALLEQFAMPHFFPVTNPANRPFVLCQEPTNHPHLLDAEAPDDAEFLLRQQYFEHHTHYVGRAWWIFHRSAVEQLLLFLEGNRSTDTWSLFMNSFMPDENFLQTIIMNGLVMPLETVQNNNYRFRAGKPLDLSDSYFPATINRSDAFFARKVDHGSAERLRAEIERRVSAYP